MVNKKNTGQFKKGFDPRRHRLTRRERSRGGQTAFRRMMDNKPWMLLWLQKKISKTAKPGTIAAYKNRRLNKAG